MEAGPADGGPFQCASSRAVAGGVPPKDNFMWSAMDDFEWINEAAPEENRYVHVGFRVARDLM
jgi:hypothetical protein